MLVVAALGRILRLFSKVGGGKKKAYLLRGWAVMVYVQGICFLEVLCLDSSIML